ncbi:MAG: YggS family pyridoxal phosphate-dependent enzyme [Burkholderiales bacterium]|mgnify:CR=1 FL=1
MTTISVNLATVQARIQAACAACGRPRDAVQLLAVSKRFGPQAVRAAWAAGQWAFGENYVQEAVEKITALQAEHNAASQAAAHSPQQPALQWHLIGPLQTNKTRTVAAHFDWLHTLDSTRLAQRLNDQRPPHLPPLQVCIQVNSDGDAAKSGVPADTLVDFALALALQMPQLPRLRLRGLMAIGAPQADYAAQLAQHRVTRALFDAVAANALPGLTHWNTLSMGMSDDLEAAIEAGSNLVRVGTAVFGSRVSAA